MAAVAHVVAEDSGVGFVPQPGQQLFYDEAAGCIHLIEGRMITAVALPAQHPHGGSGAGGPAAAGASPSRGANAHSHSAEALAAGYDSDSSIASSTARAFLVSEGPPVRHIRSSLDGAFTALHRSARLVEVHCHATGNMFVETAGVDKAGRRGGDPRLLGFFWTAAHFVMVTAGGLEVHTVHPSLQGLRLDSTVPLQGIQWYTYSPETHMVVLGFGSSGAKLQAIQFSKAGTLKLPLLDLTPPWGSPIRPGVAAAVSAALDGFSAAREQPARLVGPDTCWVVVLYGRVFCCHHDRGAGLLRLYRLFRDATSLAYQSDVFARQLELSVVDNVLLVHHIDSAVVMLIDILAAGTAPISSPLPLAVPLAEQEHAHDLQDPSQELEPALPASSGSSCFSPSVASGTAAAGLAAGPAAAAAGLAAGPAAAAAGVPAHLATPGSPNPSALQLHYPYWLVDTCAGLVYRLQLDLGAVADSQSDYPHLLAFLQRRRASSAPVRDAAAITLCVLRGLIREEAPLPELRVAFDVVNSFAAEAAAAAAAAAVASRVAGGGGSSAAPCNSTRQQQRQLRRQQQRGASPALHTQQHDPPQQQQAGLLAGSSMRFAVSQQRPVVTPQDVYNSAFSLLRAQQRCRPASLQAALGEYVGSCHAHGAELAPSLATLYVDLLLDQGLPHLVAPLLLSHPMLDSVLLAEHVEEAGTAWRLPGGGQLAEQLLLRLGAHEARCRLLLRQGRVRQALLLARREGLVGQLVPEALVEAAAEGGERLLEAAARRVCSAAQPAAA